VQVDLDILDCHASNVVHGAGADFPRGARRA
jgi:hypothetical protein